MATKHHIDFWVLLQDLFRKQKMDWREDSTTRRVSRVARDTYKQLSQWRQWKFVDDSIIAKWKQGVESPVDFGTEHCVMVLPPLEKDASFVPVMSLSYQPCAEFPKSCLRIRVFLVGREKTGNDTHFIGIGFRIESPEKYCQAENGQPEKMGSHDFYHAQLIKEIEHAPLVDVPDWLPCTQPSFPLWAVNPIDAVLNLILTLYGGEYYRHLLSDISQVSSSISPEFAKANELYFE